MQPAKTRAHGPHPHHSPKVIKQAIAAAYTVNIDEPTSLEALTAARLVLGYDVNKGTLQKWMIKFGAEVKAVLPEDNTPELIAAAHDDILAHWQEVRTLSLERAKATVHEAGYRDVMVGAGISDDHILKRQAVPVEVEMAWRRLMVDATRIGYDPIEMLVDFVEHVHQRASLPPPPTTDGTLLVSGEDQPGDKVDYRK